VDLLDRLSLELPIAQAGLGGGLAGADLAAAVSGAGALGTLGIMPAPRLAGELARARSLAPGRPIAVNLLMPFVRPAHVDAVLDGRADAAVLFFGFDPALVARLRQAGVVVLHQVGTVAQARRALADGADGLIAQGLEAGGHLLAEQDLRSFLAAALEVADGRPVLAAGGIASSAGVRDALDAGASGVVCGTRFLLTRECRAHPLYQRRVLDADRTLETSLFSLGWYARHRVVPNAATERWCARDPAGPRLVRDFYRVSEPLAGRVPLGALARIAKLQDARVPLFSPGPALAGMPDRVVEATPLYGGECARRIEAIVPAAEALATLADGVARRPGSGAGPA
jgi:nitronate monooxygenase